jgi:hypothetical protein
LNQNIRATYDGFLHFMKGILYDHLLMKNSEMHLYDGHQI